MTLAQSLAYEAEVPLVEVLEVLSSEHLIGIRKALQLTAGYMAAKADPNDVSPLSSPADWLRAVGLTEPVVRWVLGETQKLNAEPIYMHGGTQMPLPDEFLPRD